METIKLLDHTFELYIDNKLICEATKRLAQKINIDYANAQRPPILLITLSGAMMFASELVKHLTIEHKWGFVKCSSYQNELCCGEMKLQVEPTIELQDEDIIIIEDIVDTGNTWEFLHKLCLEKGAKTVEVATMTFKNTVYKKSLPVKYIALKIEDAFVVGYGMDYAQHGRNLTHIYKIVK